MKMLWLKFENPCCDFRKHDAGDLMKHLKFDEKSVLIIGGGIAGLQVASDLAKFGIKVYLVERLPSLGGHVSLLSTVFPTLTDADKIVSQKISEVSNYSNVQILTNAEVKEVNGTFGDFKVKIVKEPRYVDEKKCTACGKCVEVCPVSIPKENEMGLSYRKAIYMPFKAFPKTYLIDEDNCLHFKGNECKACVEACPENAIDLSQTPIDIDLKVDAIVLATGFDLFDARKITQYGYGTYKNVITGLEYERLAHPEGPTNGRIVRISDGKEPKSVVFLLCVGSRDKKYQTYCCRIGCPNALKHAYILKKQYGENVDAYICYIDIRTSGKGLEEFYQEVRRSGITLIHGQPSEIRPLPDGSLNVEIFDTATHKLLSIIADLVVLETAIIPCTAIREVLNLPLSQYGFFQEKDLKLNTTETQTKGIFLAGTVQGPKNITETIEHASTAAIRIMEALTEL